MTYNNLVLALDPSGNYNEGKGTTGWCASNDGFVFAAGQIYAAEYATQFEYWEAVISKILRCKNDSNCKTFKVVCEGYRLYQTRAESQINSELETPQLIGVIKWVCAQNNIPLTLQMANEVKIRWSNKVLLECGIITQDWNTKQYHCSELVLSDHSLDALRHLTHFNVFKEKTRKVKKMPLIREYANYD